MAREEKSGVEKLKHELYARDHKPGSPVERTPLSPSAANAPTAWAPPETPPTDVSAPQPVESSETTKRMSFAAKFLIGSVGFFVLASGLAAYVFFGGANITSPQNIDLEVVAPSLVDGGKEVQFDIVIRNRNTTELELADLVITYPPGSRHPNNPTQDLVQDRQSIGTIKSGEQVKRTAQALVYGREGEQQTVQVKLEYSIVGSNAVFERYGQAQFTIGSSPVSVTVSSPQEAIAGQPLTFTIEVRSNATTPVNDLVVKGEYPFGFQAVSAEPKADAGGIWRLGTLQPGASRTVTLVGTVEGEDGDERIFRFVAGSNDDQTDPKVKVPYITVPQTLTVRRPFIGGAIAVEGQSGKTITVSSGSKVNGIVSWQNNLPEAASDVELVLSFKGPALEKDSIQGQGGFYQSSDASIIWSKDQNPSLASVAPGATGEFQFSFDTKSPGAGGTLITNPTIDLNLTVRAVRPASGVPETIGSAAVAKVTVASALSLGVQSLHFSGPFQNSGPMPPRAESPTTYTIVWAVKNSSNTVGNGLVSATLPTYVKFLGAQAGSGISYNEGSRTVSWSLGDIKAGVGYTLASRTAAFQVELMPSVSQVGQAPSLTSAPLLTGQDRFAQVQLSAEGQVPTTKLVGDNGFQNGMDVVAPK